MALLFQPLILCVKGSFLVNIKWSDAEACSLKCQRIPQLCLARAISSGIMIRKSPSWPFILGVKTQGTNCFHSLLKYLIKSGSKCHETANLNLALQIIATNTAADSYKAMKRMACNNSRWKAADQLKD